MMHLQTEFNGGRVGIDIMTLRRDTLILLQNLVPSMTLRGVGGGNVTVM